MYAYDTKVREGDASVGWAARRGGAILEEHLKPSLKKVEMTTMHEAMVSLLLMVIVMFPCFLSAATPE